MSYHKYFQHPSSGRKVFYSTVKKALNGDRVYTMSLASQDEIRAVTDCVNHGIDAHLEACYIAEQGDKFATVPQKIGGRITHYTLDCELSGESLCVLLRRLSEVDFEDSNEAGSLVAAILETLGIDEYGRLQKQEIQGSA